LQKLLQEESVIFMLNKIKEFLQEHKRIVLEVALVRHKHKASKTIRSFDKMVKFVWENRKIFNWSLNKAC